VDPKTRPGGLDEAQEGPKAMMKSIFSVDVEDWFHILDVPSAPKIDEWNALPSCVERNFRRLLDIFREHGAQTTCFFLGYVAERFPHLVKEAHEAGHEIASHGYGHQLIYSMKPQEFLEDVKKSKAILEDTIGGSVLGYRAPGFSMNDDTPWFMDKLLEAGYRYDSSVFPAPRAHGGLNSGQYYPHRTPEGLLEFPITVTKLMGQSLCFFGGGYLRLFPYGVIRGMSGKVLAENRPVIYYIHPREIDPNHPRLSLSWSRRFKSYVNLRSTERKVRGILRDFEVTTFSAFIAENPSLFSKAVALKRGPQSAVKGKSASEVA
jgi:polysaccharide deacetylase family protein (PEP-CTERM system associated)